MATFRVQFFYQRGTNEKWSNVWHVDATSIANARLAAGNIMLPHLLALLNSVCKITKLLVSDPASTDFIEVAVNNDGTSSSGGTLLPLFNSVKAFFATTVGGRPDYKFLKGYLTEDLHSAGDLATGVATSIDVELTEMLSDMAANGTNLISENGDVWSSPSVQESVQMRQMHRRRRRT
jgi:hypothetical protein